MDVVEGPLSIEDDRWLLGLHHPEAGVVAVRAIPGLSTFLPVAGSILESLGKRQLPTGFHPHDAKWLPLWLRAHEIHDAILARADLYPAEVIVSMSAVLNRIGCHLWLVVEPSMAPVLADALDVPEAERCAWVRFRARWQDLAPAADLDPIDPALDLAPLWRAEHDRLRWSTTGAMDSDPYAIGFWEAARWTNGGSISAARTAQRLRGLLERFEDRACRIQAARGADVGLRPYGWEVHLDVQRLAGGPHQARRQREDAIRLSDVAVERDPSRSAPVALAARGLRVEEILEIRLGDLAPDLSSVRLRRDTVPLPRAARPLIRALVLCRTDEGAGPMDHLLAGSPAPSVSSVTYTILATQTGLDDSILIRALNARPGEDERWLNDHGVRLTYRRVEERPPLRPENVDPDLFRKMLLEGLASEARERRSCSCSAAHPTPEATTMPPYPPTRLHAQPPSDHPWRSSWSSRVGDAPLERNPDGTVTTATAPTNPPSMT